MKTFHEKYKFCKTNADAQFLEKDLMLLERYNPNHRFSFKSCKDADVLHQLLDYASEDEILRNRMIPNGMQMPALQEKKKNLPPSQSRAQKLYVKGKRSIKNFLKLNGTT